MTDAPKRVAIIGAGASGLPAIHHALLYGFEPVCFELTDDVGGLWRYKPNKREFNGIKVSSVMRTTVINTSKELTAYSDYAPNEAWANYMHNRYMLQYLRDYAEHFGLHKYVKLHHRVDSVERAGDFATTGQWVIKYTDDKNKPQTETFDAVILANGHHAEPRWPDKYPGQETFKGQILHSHDYVSHVGYEDKNILIVGIGNSGGDLAIELSRIGSQVYLSTRRGCWILNRLQEGGGPTDVALSTRYQNAVRNLLGIKIASKVVERQLKRLFDYDAYGLTPEHSLLGAHPTVNDELPNRLANKTVRICTAIDRFTEHDVFLTDGTHLKDIDVVIFSTGFKFNFPLVENGTLVPVQDGCKVDLYLNIFPPSLNPHNTLAILGLVQPWGSIMPLSEMQARVFFDALSGGSKLPSANEMKADIAKKRQEMALRYVSSPRHTIQVDYGTYMDELASKIGAVPNLLQLAFTDPVLAWQVFFGPQTSYIYRINGPHPWTGARQAILTSYERIRLGMAPEGAKAIEKARQKLSSCGCRKCAQTASFAVIVGILGYILYAYFNRF